MMITNRFPFIQRLLMKAKKKDLRNCRVASGKRLTLRDGVMDISDDAQKNSDASIFAPIKNSKLCSEP